jgi:GH43 family beta-xylosidase
MSKLEESLSRIAENILCLDEASLTSLWDKYKTGMENFSFTPEWEKSVVIFSMINAIRVKNAIFNEQMLKMKTADENPVPKRKTEKPNLRLVK